MHRKIFLEGPDCGGKTMLVGLLKQNLGWDDIHLTAPHERQSQVENMSHHLRGVDDERPLISDRSWLSDWVYADLYRDGCRLKAFWQSVNAVSYNRGHQYIMCLPDYPTVEHAWKLNEEYERYPLEDAKKIYKEYERAWEGWLKYWPHWHRWDYTSMKEEQILAFLEYDYEQRLVLDRALGMGSTPKVIFVLNQPSAWDDSEWPLYNNGPSCKLFWSMVAKLGLADTEFLVLNENRIDGSPDMDTEYLCVMANGIPIVKLGGLKSEYCTHHIHHPAWAVRFGHQVKWVNLVREAISS